MQYTAKVNVFKIIGKKLKEMYIMFEEKDKKIVWRKNMFDLLLLLLLSFFSWTKTCFGGAENETSIEVFFESLCPFSQKFVAEELVQAYQKLGKTGLKITSLHWRKQSSIKYSKVKTWTCLFQLSGSSLNFLSEHFHKG